MPQTEEDVQARQVELRAGEDVVQLHLEYDSLQLAELNELLAHLSGAYEIIARRVRVRRRAIALPPHIKSAYVTQLVAPLRIATIDTRHSIILICIGAGVVIERLASIATKVFKARKTGWESSGAKWKAKKAKADYEATPNRPLPTFFERKTTLAANQRLKELAEEIENTDTIRAVQLKLDGFSWTYVKSDTTRTLKP
jgi:hypothetical protein